jgi:glycoprotein endo-alpha-1,2-mannosidase
MKYIKNFLLLAACTIFSISFAQQETVSRDKVQIFYYGWYGNLKTDGSLQHWNHEIIPHWSNPKWNNLGHYKGGDDIGANFYPELGNYSSNDRTIIEKHMKMIKDSGVGVVVVSWLGKILLPIKV